MSNNDRVLLEDIDHKLDAIMEGQQAMAHVPAKISRIEERLDGIESELVAIKAVARDHSELLSNHTRQLLGHDTRLATLERPAA